MAPSSNASRKRALMRPLSNHASRSSQRISPSCAANAPRTRCRRCGRIFDLDADVFEGSVFCAWCRRLFAHSLTVWVLLALAAWFDADGCMLRAEFGGGPIGIIVA